MLLENQKQRIDDLPENTIYIQNTINKKMMTVNIVYTFNGPPGVCKQ